jgi:NADH dehydrogenase
MVATNGRTVTVFGGTGFLGRRIARHLRYREFTVRIASRHPDRGHRQFGPYDPQINSGPTTRRTIFIRAPLIAREHDN